MQKLRFPTYQFKIKNRENKLFIFDPIRKKELLLQPEEWVRQHCIKYLEEQGYPLSKISVEKALQINGMTRRTDILTYDSDFNPYLVVECKAPSVPINQDTFDQIARYNMVIKAPYLMLSNGMNHYFCKMNHENKSYEFLREIPKHQ